MAARVPTYVTIKDVKRRWGHGQEDVFPVAQFEKLWGDLTSLPDLPCSFLAVDRRRGQQLKDAAQLDGWANDGSTRPRAVALRPLSRGLALAKAGGSARIPGLAGRTREIGAMEFGP